MNGQGLLSSASPHPPLQVHALHEAQLSRSLPAGQDAGAGGAGGVHGGPASSLAPDGQCPGSLPPRGSATGLPMSSCLGALACRVCPPKGARLEPEPPSKLAPANPRCLPKHNRPGCWQSSPGAGAGASGNVPAQPPALRTAAALRKRPQPVPLISQSPSELQVFLP